MWLQILDSFNGKSFFLTDVWETSNTLELYTDSAGSRGYGAVFGTHWLYGKWPPLWHHLNVATLELFTIVIALHIRGPKIANKCIILFTNNAALIDIINKQTSQDKVDFRPQFSSVLLKVYYTLLFSSHSGFSKRKGRLPLSFSGGRVQSPHSRHGCFTNVGARGPTAREVVDKLKACDTFFFCFLLFH